MIEVKTDPEVRLSPPHITFQQAKKLMGTFVSGDKDEGDLITGWSTKRW